MKSRIEEMIRRIENFEEDNPDVDFSDLLIDLKRLLWDLIEWKQILNYEE